MTETVSQTSQSRLDMLIVGVGILMVFYHMLSVWVPMFDALLHQNAHLGFAFVLLFLVAIRQSAKKWEKITFTGLLLIGVIVVVYMHVEQERLHMWAGYPESLDVVIGLAMVSLIFFLTWKSWGSIFPILVSVSVLYALFGHLIEGALGHPEFEPGLVLSNLGIGFAGTYGMLLNASANLIFLFIIFGSLFELVGIDRFFIEVGTFLGRHLRGGSAQTAVFSSSFVGMCTGAAAANVALTGAYTIPLMKRTGFKGEHAGAIEAVASTGGQLTPPVMGVAIFLMASFLGVSYAELMATALIPAVFYYAIAMLGVILIASKVGVPMLKADINRDSLIHGAPLFLIPIGLITYLLIMRYTPAYSALVAIIALLAIAVLRKETRPSPGVLLKGMAKGAVMGATIAVACAMIGMFTSMLTFTGAGPKIAGLIEALSGGNFLLALIFTMLLAILLGCAMPTPVAYVVTALVVAPVLENMGLSLIMAHFFVFYYAILSAVTPPVAGAALVGSRLAGAGYLSTGWESLKLIAPFFLLPFFMIRNPVILSMAQPLIPAVLAIISLILACLAFMAFCQGYLFAKTNPAERIGFLIVAIASFLFGFYGYLAALATGIILFTGLCGFQIRKRVRVACPENQMN
ncbi:MAG: TRAP transporter fused permease subunit [Deltaproteobacteria bacterium]|jgi:TRAP transporter 4TM/12TM fusion protein|nr:TRAP transporter fused permease subunit [Deltaproteobacteria bacterium]MBT4640925.1 TRAP transporter fused permease subunit [Deltaproteobacteria bacterium]MBT6500445.1 TRAP transporter fused permease subunit [Deltaproteobacteria bacterium]MBT7153428.1 TRAP transporter fused permease subunit [Deltaproteobacteria bacterium]MBT7711308.1 TRAP transporter fused permease subunit [Deltaproteobacteria bacterium]